jgi:3-deoxy-D-manno-octulosonate 8-phosphate phosphatase (KDO 8-P phosphatase)
MADVEKIFTSIGGTLIIPFNDLKNKAKKIKAFVFDWDGVFNNGSKTSDKGSPFAEPVQVYNNIENGFGIFGSESLSVDTLEIN